MLVLICASAAAAQDGRPLRVGSKSFTEGIILGEVATLQLREAGIDVVHEQALGDASTFQALVRGDIDIYAEYTGTLRTSIFADRELRSDDELAGVLDESSLKLTEPLGFENSFALGTTQELAARLGLRTASDLKKYPELRFGFTESFLNRGDGWPGLKAHYQLPHTDPRGMVHDLAYVALDSGDLDVIDLYTTDAEIVAYDLFPLEDDRNFFPRYEAIYLYRADLVDRLPEAVKALRELEASISSDQMRAMNAAVKIDKRSEREVAAEFLEQQFGYEIEVKSITLWGKLWARTREHLFLVGVAMSMGIVMAIPLGVVAQKKPTFGAIVLPAISILQTIPALALLALMVPLLGIKSPPAIAALFCYSMLPIVRNTHAGLSSISRPIRESAEALGLSPWQQLWAIELPLAAPLILAGVKTSTILCIGFATLGAFVGAGGYGEPILTGIRLQDTGVILQGAVPAALLAVGSEFLFNRLEPLVVPKGLRLKSSD
jgi:osmoprotectant transport system permease protein